MSLPTYYEFIFWDASGKNVGGARAGFSNPDLEVRKWCHEWMTINKNLRPIRWTYKFVGGSLRA